MIRTTVDQISAEFLELPGLRLSVRQASRLWALDPVRCKAILDGLVDAKFLCVMADSSYARAVARPFPRTRPIKVRRRRVLASA